MTVTRRKAESVLAAVRATYSAYLEGLAEADQPQLFRGDDGWQVSWESGPFEWAMHFAAAANTGTPVDDPEMTALAADFGATGQATWKAPRIPAGVFCEPWFSYSLGIYPA